MSGIDAPAISFAIAFCCMAFNPVWLASFSPLVLRWLLLHAQTSKARRVHGAAIFRASGIVALCATSSVLALGIAIGGWNQEARTLTTVTGTVWLLFSLWLWPATIVLDAKGVTAKHIWRRTRVIPYTDIDYVSRYATPAGDGQTIVYGNGRWPEIRVSQYHAAPGEFEAALKKRGVKFYR